MTPEEFAQRLVKAGVVLDYDSFAEMPPEAQDAFIAAREQDRAEFAAMIGTAMQGERGAAWVMRKADGGAAWVGLHLERAMGKWMAREEVHH